MNPLTGLGTYKVLAVDNVLYGPVDMPALIQWTVDERVLPGTWIMRGDNSWVPAGLISDLAPYFARAGAEAKSLPAVNATGQVQPEELRQFDLFVAVSNEQLAQFLEYAEFLSCDADHVLIKKGDLGDAIYFLLSGKVRARIMVACQEKDLTTIPSGEFFGEIAMLTHSARSVDIVALEPSRLLRVGAQSFFAMSQELPNLACPILFAMSRSLAGRVADLTVRVSRDQAAEHLWS
jgi:CRP-like cAMP-binding protein